MTRRGALLGALLMAAGEPVRADQDKLVSTTNLWEPEPASLSFDFTNTSFKSLVLKFPDKTLTFTREELQREFEGDGR